MEEDDKPFACPFTGCNMRFTNEDHLMVHKKKHDMVLNLGNGQKSNAFVADQTPTPTRFIRNCEEVGLFQDLQNVNPFEETFRKAVELVKTGSGPLHEVDSLSVHTGSDDTLHTPHVFPHIIEDSTSNSSSTYKNVTASLISSTSVITENGRKKSSDHQELDQLLHPTSTTEETKCHSEITLQQRRVEGNRNIVIEVDNTTKVVRQEADTSQQKVIIKQRTSGHVITANAANKNGTLSTEPPTSHTLLSTGGNTVQLLLRLPDGKLLQLSALPVEQDAPPAASITCPPGGVLTQPSQVETHPVSAPAVVFTTRPPVVSAKVPVIAPGIKNSRPAAKASPSPSKQPSNVSAAKLKLKQTLASKNKTTASTSEAKPKQPQAKAAAPEAANKVPITKATSLGAVASAKQTSSSNATDDKEDKEKRQKFLERNRAAAVRCREKRKSWIKELERRAEDMLNTNQQLQSEVAALRAEVAQLKTLLLAHKDCPVTQAMTQGTGGTAQTEQPHIINVTLPIPSNSNDLLSSSQSSATLQQSPTHQNQLILFNDSSGVKRGSSEPILTPKKKAFSVPPGSSIIRQLLLPTTNPESIKVINNKTVTSIDTVSQSSLVAAGVNVASMSAIHSGVLVANPIISTPVTVAANQLAFSAVIQNSHYQQALLVPKIVAPDVCSNPAVVSNPCLQRKEDELHSNKEICSQVIKINPNVMRKTTENEIIVPDSNEDSDVEIVTEILPDVR